MMGYTSVYSKACSLGYPYIDVDGGKPSADGKTWLGRFTKKNSWDLTHEGGKCEGIFIGWDGKKWIIEREAL
jgi:hypothetical protein